MAGSSIGASTVTGMAARRVLFYRRASEIMMRLRDYASHFGFTVLSSAAGGRRRGLETLMGGHWKVAGPIGAGYFRCDPFSTGRFERMDPAPLRHRYL